MLPQYTRKWITVSSMSRTSTWSYDSHQQTRYSRRCSSSQFTSTFPVSAAEVNAHCTQPSCRPARSSLPPNAKPVPFITTWAQSGLRTDQLTDCDPQSLQDTLGRRHPEIKSSISHQICCTRTACAERTGGALAQTAKRSLDRIIEIINRCCHSQSLPIYCYKCHGSRFTMRDDACPFHASALRPASRAGPLRIPNAIRYTAASDFQATQPLTPPVTRRSIHIPDHDDTNPQSYCVCCKRI